MSNDWITGHAWRDGVYVGLMNARQETWAENGWVEGEKPAPTPDELLADAKAARASAYTQEADPLFFKWQRGEATEQEWLDKIEEIRARYPYPEDEE